VKLMSSGGEQNNTAVRHDETVLKITWVKSSIGYSQRQKGTIRALGLRHLGHSVEQADTPAIRGMIGKVSHLLQVEEIEGK
jgi:large subunit ribosomal protein L30